MGGAAVSAGQGQGDGNRHTDTDTLASAEADHAGRDADDDEHTGQERRPENSEENMNPATSGADPTPQAEKNSEMSGNRSDVSHQILNAVNSQVTSGTTAQNDYSVYLRTPAAEAAAHGIFVVTPDPNPKDAIHTTKKMPETQGQPPRGEGGVKSYKMTAVEALKTTGPTRFLGRRFGAGDGIIALDCDGWHPPADWTRGTGYREKSASGTGDHIIARIPIELVPSGSNKIKRPHAGGGDIEIFYDRGNGVAISGREATAGPIDLDMESEAGKLVLLLISGAAAEETAKTRAAAGVRAPRKTSVTTPGDEPVKLNWLQKHLLKDIVDNAYKYYCPKRNSRHSIRGFSVRLR